MTRIPVKIENQHEAQDENGGVENNVHRSRRNSFDENEPKLMCGNQVFPDRDAIQGGQNCRRETRILGGRLDQGHGDYQEHSDNLAHGFPLDNHMFQSQQGRGYWRPPNPRKSPHTHRARGPEGTFHERDPLFHVRDHSSFTQRGQGRDQSRRGRGRVGQGHDGTHEHPVYLADKINEICRSFDDLDLGDKDEIAGPNKCG